jgi:hypothetical protein
LGKEYQYLRVRIKTEQCRLLDWANVTKLTERDETFLISRAGRTITIDILDQQRRILTQFGRFDDRLRPLSEPLVCDETENESKNGQMGARTGQGNPGQRPQTAELFNSRFPHAEALLEKSLEFINRTSRCTTRLRWAISDKGKIEELIQKLTALNGYLAELLNTHQLEMLMSRQVRTDYQIMQLNNKMDHLQEIIESGFATQTTGPHKVSAQLYHFSVVGEFEGGPPPYTESFHPRNLTNLAQFKALSSAIDSNTLTDKFAQKLELGQSAEEIKSVELYSRDITLMEPELSMSQESQRVEAWYKTSTGKRQQVWIEWKDCESQAPYGAKEGPNPKVLSRLNALVTLLRENKRTEQFRAPPCLGYFLHEANEDRFRFGLVFEKPTGVDPSTKPLSLLELLRDESGKVPSLTARAALARAIAESIERLHAVNWLHKGLRSDNIIFFRNEKLQCDFSKPYLSGFDYSRPAQREDLTEKPSENVAYDLYRHPQVQGGARDTPNGKGFKRRYDIYSFGVILMEIAYWQPIDVILGFKDLQRVRPSETARVRGRLLNPEYLDYVESYLGDTIHSVIHSCLQGVTSFGIHEEADETDVFTGARLQAKFYDLVVKQLQSLKV